MRLVGTLLVGLLLGCGSDPVEPAIPDPTPAERSGVLADIQARGVLRVGTEFQARPMVYLDNGAVTGFEVRIMEGIAQRLGVKLEPVGGAFKDLPATLEAGAVDIVIGGWIPSQDLQVAFSKSYLETGLCLVVRKGSPIRSIDDLGGKKVGIFTDPTVQAWADRTLAGSTVTAFSDGYFKLLVGEELDAVVYDYPYTVAEIEPYREQLQVAQLNLSTIRYSVLVPPGNDDLLSAINGYIEELRGSKEYGERLREFLDPALASTAPPSLPKGARVHTSRPGETLQDIARRYYDDPDRWRNLWKANKAHVAFPELLVEGTPILVP